METVMFSRTLRTTRGYSRTCEGFFMILESCKSRSNASAAFAGLNLTKKLFC
jgi:hypothetical protein